MTAKPIELLFWPGEGAVVRDLRAMRVRPGAPEFIGMRHDPEAGGLVATGEPGRVVVLPADATLDLAAYAKDVRAGHIVPADEATAARFGVKFEPRPPKAPDVVREADAVVPDVAPGVIPLADAALESPPGPHPPAEGQGRAFLTPERPEAQAPDVATVEPAWPAAEPKKGGR